VTTVTYKVNVGYTRCGNPRWRRFPSLDGAKAFCADVFARTGVVLAIVPA
jgi:hypothetical protein